MKLGILTLPLHTNYGGILQAFALQKILKEMGHEAVLIERERTFKVPLKSVPLTYAKRLTKKYLFNRKETVIFYEKKKREEYAFISANTRKFILQHINPRLKVKTLNQIPKNYFDGIVVGSDQIWRPIYNNQTKIENAFLSFTKQWNHLKRIAYAASFGTSEWEYTEKQTLNCKQLVNKFDAVSVREDFAVNLCKEKFNINAELVLDPTMLLNVKEYINLAQRSAADIDGDLFVYILDNTDENKKATDFICSKGYKPFYASTDNLLAKLEDRTTIPVEKWLKSVYEAKFIITDSFHACAFSILFNKQFIVYGNEGRGLSRFESLLKMFNLKNRMITEKAQLTEQLIKQEIDWSDVNLVLTKYKKISLQFLNDNLNK